jgi:hypothetical protein
MIGYYSDTEMLPLFNWRMINEKNDLTYLRLDKSKGDKKNDSKAWNVILDTYYAEFGLSEDYEVLLELKQDLAVVNCDFAISGNAFLQNKIRHLNEQIKELIERPVEGDLNSAINFKREIQELKKQNNG